MTVTKILDDMRKTAAAHEQWAHSAEATGDEAATATVFAQQIRAWMDELAALSASEAGVDPSKDLATAFAEKFPQQDLPADAAKVFRENYSALLNEEPPAGVDHQAPEARIAELEAAIRWALGEIGDFGEEPEPLLGKYRQRYWWRTELRQRAKLAGVGGGPDAGREAAIITNTSQES